MEYYTLGMTIGMAIGIAIGISIGIVLGKKQKPWAELSEEEKKRKKILIGAGVVLLVLGVLINLWFFFRVLSFST
jgi:uncharacterized BrkB/YihY/UPF0761 family membrane protein